MNNVKPIKIYIDSSKPYYYPGENLAASILLDVFERTECNKMQIIAKGKNIVQALQKNEIQSLIDEDEIGLDEMSNDSDDEKGKKPKKRINRFLDDDSIEQNERDIASIARELNEDGQIFKYKKIVKISNENYIAKGKYTFPFELEIPDNIPASFLYMDKNTHVEIIYSIKVKINKINIKEMIPIVIRQKEKIFNYPKSNENTKLLKGCCFDKHESTIKLNIVAKHMINTNEIKLNIVLDNSRSNLQGSPINVELYQKITIFPKDPEKKTKITKIVGKYKGKRYIPARDAITRNISFLMDKSQYTTQNIDKTIGKKYYKHKDVIPFLNQSIKSDIVNCEYEAYAECQFTNWTLEELGVFLPIVIYPPEIGILSKTVANKSKEFINSIVNKKFFLSNQTKEEDPDFKGKPKKKVIHKSTYKDKNKKKEKHYVIEDSGSEMSENDNYKPNNNNINKEQDNDNIENDDDSNFHNKIKKELNNSSIDKNQLKNSNNNIYESSIINSRNENMIESKNFNNGNYNNVKNEDGSFGNFKKDNKSSFIYDKNSNNIKKNFNYNYLNDPLDDEFLDKESFQ